jgi:hypothetical protein
LRTISTHTEIASDGTLRLELPMGLSSGPVDVVIVVQPIPLRHTTMGQRLSGKYAAEIPPYVDAMDEVLKIRHQATREAQEIPE